MSRVSDLYRLQSIDLEMDSLLERLEEIDAILSDDRKIHSRREKLQSVTDRYDDLHSKTTAADHEVLSQRDKIRRTEDTLYSGTIMNPKELEDLQLESESLKKYLVILEDRLLDVMVELEEVEAEKVAAQASLDTAIHEQEKEHAQLVHEQEKMNKRRDTLLQEREAALTGLSEQDLETYKELRERFSGPAIASLQGDNCSACGLEIPPSIRQTVRSVLDLVRCPQCSRILYPG
jgi:predicted  nucleic acid-binding Zn-ribbon protein